MAFLKHALKSKLVIQNSLGAFTQHMGQSNSKNTYRVKLKDKLLNYYCYLIIFYLDVFNNLIKGLFKINSIEIKSILTEIQGIHCI